MTTTTLSVNYDSLRREVGRFLGFDPDYSNWTTSVASAVDDVLAAGLRLFYRPPRLPSERAAHQWSFLRPIITINTRAGYGNYDLPADFAGLDGDWTYYTTDNAAGTVVHVSEAQIRVLRQGSDGSGAPKRCAMVPKVSDNQSDQTYTLFLWPIPDEVYTLQARYFARQMRLSENNPVPLGGSDHAETIRAACFAAAEEHLDDELGPKRDAFMMALQASVDFDRRATSPENLGYNSAHEQVDIDTFTRATSALTQYLGWTDTDEDTGDTGEGEGEGEDEIPVLAIELEDTGYLQWEDDTYVEWEA